MAGAAKAKYAGSNIGAGEAGWIVYFTLGEVLTVFLLGAAGLYFMGSIRVRELAVQAVARASQRDDFQLLDQSVHIRRVSLSRDDTGRWRIWRQYRFDYSYDGVERRQGYVTMLGKRLHSLIVSEPAATIH